MDIDWNRGLSSLVALSLLGLAVYSGEPGNIIGTLIILVWPIAFIWWADLLGSMTGMHCWRVRRASAGWLVRAFGWVLLVLIAVWFNVRGPQ
jgi:hypothetical protein